MAMNRTSLDNLWEILTMVEDYCTSGYRQDHPPAPRLTETPGESAPAGTGEEELALVHAAATACTRCALCRERKNVVCGEGVLGCKVFVVGDTPDGLEEKMGLPFAGQSGEYLDKWLQAIQLKRNGYTFLSNLIKCRAQDDRRPEPEEIAACFPYLEAQIRIVKPEALLCTGLLASRVLTGNISSSLESLRGKVYNYCRIPLVVTYHPRAVLTDPTLRAKVWTDLKLLRTLIE